MLLSATLLLVSVYPPLVGEPRVRETFQEWTVVCDTPEQLETEVCVIVQERQQRETERLVIRVEVGFAVQTGRPFAVITVPLGVALQAGLIMQVDDGEDTRFEFGSCIPKGCLVGTGLSQELLEIMMRGFEAQLTFRDNRGRDLTVPVSLLGFTAAIRSIQP